MLQLIAEPARIRLPENNRNAAIKMKSYILFIIYEIDQDTLNLVKK